MQTVSPEQNFDFYTYDELCEIQRKIESNESLVIPETTLNKTEWWGYNRRAIHLLCILKALDQEKPFVKEEYKKLLQRVKNNSDNESALVQNYLIAAGICIGFPVAGLPGLLSAALGAPCSVSPFPDFVVIFALSAFFGLLLGIKGVLSFKHQTNLKSKAELCTLRFFSEKGIKLENPEPVSDKTQSKTEGFFKEQGAGVELAVMRSPS